MKKLLPAIIAFLLISLGSAYAEEGLRITPPAGREDATGYLTDDNPETHLTLERKQAVTIEWDGTDAAYLLLHWYTPSQEIRIELLDADGKTASSRVYTNTEYKQAVELTGAVAARITAERGMPCLSEVKLYRESDEIPSLETGTYKADLMVICSGVADETELLGGLLPLYAGERNIRTLLVYCGEDSGYAVWEGFQALDTLGFERYPIFMHKKDNNAVSEARVRQKWGNAFTSELFQLIRSVDPKVIVTVDPSDETTSARARYTAQVIKTIVNQYIPKVSLSLQKVYRLSPEGTTLLDYTQPLSTFGGRSALAVAKEAYGAYSSRALFNKSIPEKNTFELLYTTVGEDEEGTDLFEHIDMSTLLQMPDVKTDTEEYTQPESEEPSYEPSPYFRNEGEEEEVIVSDYDAGHWEYRSDTLSVMIDRENFQLNDLPQCIYTAYIRSRGADSFRAGLAADADADVLVMPWRLARTYKAVLAITGDNLTNAEKEIKGILIRNGTYYSDYGKEDSLAVYSSSSLSILKKEEASGLKILDSGVRNVYSFGPVLVENGEVNPDASKHRVAKGNPRCGVGMLADGTVIAIVADGRDPTRAYNLTLDEFAEIFREKGAVFAYNMDGGSSAAMVFMGENINWHSGKGDPQRTWIDALMWGYSEQVPDVSDPVNHNGDGKKY